MKPTMFKRSLLLAAGVILASTAFAQETRRVEGLSFDRVQVLGSVKVKIEQGEETVLYMYGSAADLDRGPFEIRDDRVLLGYNSEHRRYDFSNVKFRIEVPELRGLKLKGSGAVYVKPFELRDRVDQLLVSLDGSGDIRIFGINARELELRVKGSGDIKAVDVRADDVEAVVSGSGDLFFKTIEAEHGEFVVTGSGDIVVTDSGRVETMEVNIVGSGNIDLRKVVASIVAANIVGSGVADLGLIEDSIECASLGSGDVRYDGDPQRDSMQLGSGECRRRD